jgi:CheY-like chemotaxis protein
LQVLVVDDSEINRTVATSFLRQAGHAAVEACGGSEAVRLVARRDFDVVLMDMRMAGVDGLEATRRIRALQGRRGQVPIVAVTANALDQHADECRQAGMCEHLAKPFTAAELTAVVVRAAAHCPGTGNSAETTVDADCIAQLTACMGADGVQRLLDCLALRIEVLLRRIEDPAGIASLEELADLAHELVSSGGILGFAGLASAASRFEAATAGDIPDGAELRREALAALSELRRRRSLEVILVD